MPVARQRFEPVARRRSQRLQARCRVQLRQLAFRHTLDVGEGPRFPGDEQRLGIGTLERADHD